MRPGSNSGSNVARPLIPQLSSGADVTGAPVERPML
jgi:hypothetical protein